MKLKVGFIGVGAMGLSHLKAMRLGSGERAEAVAATQDWDFEGLTIQQTDILVL